MGETRLTLESQTLLLRKIGKETAFSPLFEEKTTVHDGRSLVKSLHHVVDRSQGGEEREERLHFHPRTAVGPDENEGHDSVWEEAKGDLDVFNGKGMGKGNDEGKVFCPQEAAGSRRFKDGTLGYGVLGDLLQCRRGEENLSGGDGGS